VTETAKGPLERINRFDDETNEYARMACNQYGDNIEQHRQAVLSAVESLDTAPDAASVGASTASADTTSESSADIEAESNTSVADASPADDHDPIEQDASADSDDGLGNFDAGEFDPET